MLRKKYSLNQNWEFTEKDHTETVNLPHTWNAVDGQDGGNDYYRGTCIYEKKLGKIDLKNGERAYLEINGAAMSADVYLNGVKLTHHEGGYSTFRTDLTDDLNEENLLRIEVNNAANDHVYPQYADFTFYGGLYRDVNLIVVPQCHFDLNYHGSQGLKVTPVIDLKTGTAEVTAEAWIKGNGESVTFSVGQEKRKVPVVNGHAGTVFTIANARLWNGLKDPYLYTMKACLDNGDCVETRFGIRSFEIDAQKGFLLNGKPYPLRGVSRHQDRKGAGNALTKKMHEEDIDMILEIGANAVRLAHYQHDQYFYDLCDEKGLIVWAEIPFISMFMENGKENTLSQMKELIVQNYNHPAIAVWSLSNEITAASPVTDALLENHQELNDLAHRLDPTRKTVVANVFMLPTDSEILKIPDVITYNLYFGWYLGELDENDRFFDEFHEKYPDQAIGLSEYGADANPAFHTSAPFRGDYSEEYQCIYHEHMLAMIAKRPWLWCTFVWNMFDFAADGRDEGGKHGENQKGLVTFDRKTRKDAFYVYKAYWSEDPFVHICGRRYAKRAEDTTEVRVYSNQKEVSLYEDGKLVETKQGSHVFVFHVTLTGKHILTAVSGNLKDEITLEHVTVPEPSYIFNKNSADVSNWFSTQSFDPSCYSIEDTLAGLSQNAQAGALIQKLMGAMTKKAGGRGDLADKVSGNPMLKQMMARQKLSTLLRQGGADQKTMEQINTALQKIRK